MRSEVPCFIISFFLFIRLSGKSRRLRWLFLFLMIGGSPGWTFSQNQAFKSSRIKIINYGTREQTTTISPNVVSLDLHDSLIVIHPEHTGISEFLGYQNQFEISKIFGTGITTRVYLTSTEYIFTFDSKMRVIVISKKEINPQVHSVWLEEITE